MKIARIRSGGQSGVDRAALDMARKYQIPICGWCPKDGWAEDYLEAPGLLALYPELKETTSRDPAMRTTWNMRDSQAILTILPGNSARSKGTELGLHAGKIMGKPMLTISGVEEIQAVCDWLRELPEEVELCVGGPRASECPGAYAITCQILSAVFERV